MRWRARESRAELVGRLYDEHGASLFRYALMLLADHAAAEDAVQHVFAAVMRQSGALENAAHYLRRAVRNECYSTLRRRVSHPVVAEPLLEPISVEAVSAEERMGLERAILTLPPEQREVIHLHVFEGMTFQETAAATGESINTVASRYRYALKKLRSELA
jgi:RNA polymerase sigma-70 factor, ECF subfamily